MSLPLHAWGQEKGADLFPNSQLHIYSDAGYMSIFQNASDFAARTVKFLQA
ncbi:Protein of unknown function [Lactobacillus equicursoris 66c]|uniref:Uncharacterized protein n=1 Tax=Lactobacillus equicursoris 66c TaxID=872326 RepID=K0NQT5_9LACO|nr:hypothetical protein [Lactobacillus equicursoris]CCK83338.1 Protein of unknown function [Lactobacillus equicursoris 66c]